MIGEFDKNKEFKPQLKKSRLRMARSCNAENKRLRPLDFFGTAALALFG
jgi:hypothetical protein